MRKLMCFSFILLTMMFVFSMQQLNAAYWAYEEIEVLNGKLLWDYTDADYKDYYKKVSKRRFMGWNVHTVTNHERVRFKAETLFSYYNDGITPIKYDYAFSQSRNERVQLSVSGSLSLNVKGNVKKFQTGLASKVNVDSLHNTVTDTKESWSVKFDIDPGTMVNLYVLGEGRVTNGVAARYIFWLNSSRGGFEAFTISTEYYRMEKIRI